MERGFTEGQLLAGLAIIAVLAVAGGQVRFLRLRRALGLEQLLASGFLFLPLGMLLSEAGLGIISPAVVRGLEPLVTLGLGVLGLLLGLRVEVRGPDERLILRGAAAESLFSLVLVGGPMFVLLDIASPSSLSQRAAAAALLGCVAAISGPHSLGALASRRSSPAWGLVARVADLGTVAATLAAGVLVALFSEHSQLAPLERLLALAAIGSLGGLSTWLLATGTEATLRNVMHLGTLFVTAGTAAYLGLPPIAATLLAGMTVARLPGNVAAELRRSLSFLEAPLTVLLLVTAGAALPVPGWVAMTALLVFLLLRTAGKLLGGRAAAALAGGKLPRLTGLGLLPSSAIALGLALDFASSSHGRLGETVVAVAVFGSLLSETAGVWTTRALTRAAEAAEAVRNLPEAAAEAAGSLEGQR